MAPNIPDRWLQYQPIGKRIDGTRFIAFKVPLSETINNNVHEKDRLYGKLLLKNIPNLGVIIDLTNTDRYYDPTFLKREGVEHKKLMIPGRMTPSQSLVNRFKKFVKKFIENNPNNDKLIGVHCTHGVNRTGYLICNYMVSEMLVDPLEAIRKFAEARGHTIERVNYIDSLLSLDCTKSSADGNAAMKEKSRMSSECTANKVHTDKVEKPNQTEKVIENWRIPRFSEAGEVSQQPSHFKNYNTSKSSYCNRNQNTEYRYSQKRHRSDQYDSNNSNYSRYTYTNPSADNKSTAPRMRTDYYNASKTLRKGEHGSSHYSRHDSNNSNYSRFTYTNPSADNKSTAPRMRTDNYNASKP